MKGTTCISLIADHMLYTHLSKLLDFSLVSLMLWTCYRSSGKTHLATLMIFECTIMSGVFC